MDVERLKKRVVEAYHLGRFAGWGGNRNLAVYRWFSYKEGFSKQLVECVLLARARCESSMRVLDPFCGSGTTLLTCIEHGIESVGVDASKMMALVSRIKTMRFDPVRMLSLLKSIREEFRKVEIPPEDVEEMLANPLLKRAFSARKLEEILKIKKSIESVCGRSREALFFRLALATVAYESSSVMRDGAFFRTRKTTKPSVLEEFMKECRAMINDVADFWKERTCTASVLQGDARQLCFVDCAFDLIITSPPYLKKVEYMKVYGIERFCMLGETTEVADRFFGSANQDISEKSKEIEKLVSTYFDDMRRFLAEAWRCLKSGGEAYIVVGDACIEGRVYDCCFRTAQIACESGFEVKRIYLLNRRWCTKHRSIKTGKIYEAMIWLKKS